MCWTGDIFFYRFVSVQSYTQKLTTFARWHIRRSPSAFSLFLILSELWPLIYGMVLYTWICWCCVQYESRKRTTDENESISTAWKGWHSKLMATSLFWAVLRWRRDVLNQIDFICIFQQIDRERWVNVFFLNEF